MAPKGKLHVFTVTQARHAFQRSKHILEQRVKVLSEATRTGDADKIKEAESLVQEAKGIYELRRASLSVAIFNTEKQLTDAKAVVVQQPDNIQPSTSNNIPKPTCNLVAQAPAAQHQDLRLHLLKNKQPAPVRLDSDLRSELLKPKINRSPLQSWRNRSPPPVVESVSLLRIPFPKETEKDGEERPKKGSERSHLLSSRQVRSTEKGRDRPYSYHQAKDKLRDSLRAFDKNRREKESQIHSREDSSRGSKRDRSERRYDKQPRRSEKSSRGESPPRKQKERSQVKSPESSQETEDDGSYLQLLFKK